MTKKRKRKAVTRPPQPPAPRPPQSAYPSPAQRERIIRRRDRMWQDILPILIGTSGSERNRQLDQLALKYGHMEITLFLERFQRLAAGREMIGEESFLYRTYRRTFARFGGDRPFLGKKEYEERVLEHGQLLAGRRLELAPPRRTRRERELYDLLLLGLEMWEDITPPAVPPVPADWAAPAKADYDPPLQELLTWGWNVDPDHGTHNLDHIAGQQTTPADLVRMVFDEGLLSGWPAQAASWAPYHALDLLGHLRAHQFAGRLLALTDRENDWLSDRLPTVWSQMGPETLPFLWACLGDRSQHLDKRSLALMGLKAMAQAHPGQRAEIVVGMIRHLQEASAGDAKMNAYTVFVLDRMEAVEARAAVAAAFAQEKIDTSIVTWDDVRMLLGRK